MICTRLPLRLTMPSFCRAAITYPKGEQNCKLLCELRINFVARQLKTRVRYCLPHNIEILK